MKVLNPILDVTNPIKIESEGHWERVSKILEKWGYAWKFNGLPTKWKPYNITDCYIYCDTTQKFIYMNSRLHGWNHKVGLGH